MTKAQKEDLADKAFMNATLIFTQVLTSSLWSVTEQVCKDLPDAVKATSGNHGTIDISVLGNHRKIELFPCNCATATHDAYSDKFTFIVPHIVYDNLLQEDCVNLLAGCEHLDSLNKVGKPYECFIDFHYADVYSKFKGIECGALETDEKLGYSVLKSISEATSILQIEFQLKQIGYYFIDIKKYLKQIILYTLRVEARLESI
jgi:hypothetical protein